MTTKTFRVKPNSSLDQDIDYVLNSCPDGITKTDLVENHGWTWMRADTVFNIGRFSDNFSCGRSGVSYVDVVPQTIIEQATVDSPVAHQASNEPHEQIGWPTTPVIGDVADYEWFRKPSWYDRMARLVERGRHIRLAGPPGIGKSSAVEFLAAERSKVLVNISSDAGLRRRDLTGNTELVNSHTRFDVAEYVAAAVNGWWVKVDEINAAEPDALMFLNSQLAPPHTVNFYGRSMPVHKDFRVFATYNPGLVGTKPLPDSLKDRFFPIKLKFPTRQQLRRMLEANGMPKNWGDDLDADWTTAVIEYGIRAWDAHEMGRMRYQITPRRLMDTILLIDDGETVWDALDGAVVQAVDNIAESRVLSELLSTLKSEVEFCRL